jgi:hypothetical protein
VEKVPEEQLSLEDVILEIIRRDSDVKLDKGAI